MSKVPLSYNYQVFEQAYRRKRTMTTIKHIFYTFLLAVAVCILMSGCGLLAVSKAMVEGPEKIDVKERLEMLSLDYECRPRAYDEEIDGRKEKHMLHIECYNINDKETQ